MQRFIATGGLAGTIALAACGGGHGAAMSPGASPNALSPTFSNKAPASAHKAVQMSSEADADQDVPPEAKGDVRRQMREIMRRIPKANRKYFMYWGGDGRHYAGSKTALAQMQDAVADKTSLYPNMYVGTDGRRFVVPADVNKPVSSGPADEAKERAMSSQSRAPQLAAGETPAPSTSNGPFRRVYSTPGYSYAEGDIYLPCDSPTFQNDGTKDIETAYTYTGGWGIGHYGVAVDAGFQRSSLFYTGAQPYYAPFVKAGNSTVFHYSADRITCGRSVHYQFFSPSLSNVELDVFANDPSFAPQYAATGNVGGWAPDGGTTSDGMVVKRMTTIAQPDGWSNPNAGNYNPQWYDDGSQWGFENGTPAVHWFNSTVGYYSDNTATTLYTNPWDASVTGGYQRFPDDGTRIVVNFINASEEYDAINLHNP